MKIILLYLSVFAPVAKVYKSDENNYQTEEYKFFQYVFFQKDHYITDSIAYYINIERLGGLKPCIGIDTIVLKEEGK